MDVDPVPKSDKDDDLAQYNLDDYDKDIKTESPSLLL